MNAQIDGSQLQVGDTIDAWWGRDTITAMRDYTGPLDHAFPNGARLASFALNQSGMTIDHDQEFSLLNRPIALAVIQQPRASALAK